MRRMIRPWSMMLCVGGTLLCASPALQAQEEAEIPSLLAMEDSETSTQIVSQPETIQERYPNRAVKIERQVVQDAEQNYINHGPWTYWDERGQAIARGEYDRGQRHGVWNRWFAANQGTMFAGQQYRGFERPFVSSVTFEHDQLHGLWVVEDAKGRKILEWMFERGQQNGPSMWYYPSGQKRREATFKNGQLDGTLLEWNERNELIAKEAYLEGKKLVIDVKTYPANKAKRWAKSELHPTGKLTYDWMAGAVHVQQPPKDQTKVLHGPSTWWYTSGQKQLEGTYRYGQPVDEFTWWHANGQVQVRGQFVDGKPSGKWLWWHENGQKQMEGIYLAGERQGKWSRWEADGKIMSVEQFSENSPPLGVPPTDAADTSEEPAEEVGGRPLDLRF